jgi:methylmalonyl-CoA mutase N-terminal domain/subunit
VLPHVLDAVKAYATVGELANTLRGVWGEHVETLVI